MPDCKDYDNISRSDLNKIKKYLGSQGVEVPEGDDVEIKGPFGVNFRATFDEAGKTLKVCITEKPFYIPESQIWKIIDAGAERK